MQIQAITHFLESIAPLSLQESYDNAGLLVGCETDEISGILLSLDVTEAVIEEAIQKNCNLIIAHHPIIFKGLTKLNGKNYVERTVIQAIKNNIAIYAAHTNLDHITGGVNFKIAEKLHLTKVKILVPKKNQLSKLTTFSPITHTTEILKALNEAGAGQIGDYKDCSFFSRGTGAYRPMLGTNPFEGKPNQLSTVQEDRIEVVFPSHLQNQLVKTLKSVHPYEEVAYYVTVLENENNEIGAGVIGTLAEEINELDFLHQIKNVFKVNGLRFTPLRNKKINKVAICGGSGSFLLRNAIAAEADIFITADFKYHEYFDADNKIVIADIGHYETEECTKELFYELLSKKFSNIAVLLGETVTKPYNYL
jgi:dinuclear metal center YbgI/SA1388 family protein